MTRLAGLAAAMAMAVGGGMSFDLTRDYEPVPPGRNRFERKMFEHKQSEDNKRAELDKAAAKRERRKRRNLAHAE